MWRHAGRFVIALLFLTGGPARADEPKEPPPVAPAPRPAPPPTPEQVADAVLEAVKAKDVAALKALSAKDQPDPWLVADELIRRGDFDAADAFARAAPRVDVEKLPDYVASRRGKTDDPARRARVAAVNRASGVGRFADALSALGAEEAGPIDDVVGVRLAMGRGIALAGLVRLEASGIAYRASGEGADRLGWWARAAWALFETGMCASRRGSFVAAREAWSRSLSICERRGDRAGAGRNLGNIGEAYESVGDHAKAFEALERALAHHEALGDKAELSRCLCAVSVVLVRRHEHADARARVERSLALAQDSGNPLLVANALNGLAFVEQETGDSAKALSSYERSLELLEALGDKAAIAGALVNIAHVCDVRRDHVKALRMSKRGFALAEECGQRQFAANALAVVGSAHRGLGELAKALAAFEDLLSRRVELGNELWVALALVDIGSVHQLRGEYAKATAMFEGALAKLGGAGGEATKAMTLSGLSMAYQGLGEYAKALSFSEQALALFEATGDKAGWAGELINIGGVYKDLGNVPVALSHYERGLALAEEIGHRQWAVNALNNIGGIYDAQGETEKAIRTWRKVQEQQEALGDKDGATVTLFNIGTSYTKLRDFPKALSTLEQVLKQEEALGDKAGVAETYGALGKVYADLGKVDKARASYESSKSIAKSRRIAPALVSALENLATLHLYEGKSGRALAAASEALPVLEGMMVGLGEEQGARARERYVKLFALGTVAAVREGDTAEALTFLESGRAGALLEALGTRDLARWKAETLTDALQVADRKATAAEREARRRYDAALSSGEGNREAIRAAATALDEALDDVRAVNDRIEREGKRGSGLFYPRPKTLEDVQAALDGGEALVLYGLCLDEALALVVTPTEGRVVSLGARQDVEDACAALDATDPTVEVLPALTRLKKALVEPLALGDDVKRVVISPEGPLGYLPFGALFEVPVAMTPSASTHAQLHEEDREAGEQILAVGDPDYAGATEGAQKLYTRGRPLARLPATRAEAEQIGTTTLLGAAASEDGLRSALAEHKRWRAVHFACHGLIDPERPTLSSLALSRAGKQDGFLTALEVLRMEIRSDLVVLSACETGKGKIVGGEGIVGLTRAFMYAGSPRVICSLWKVDDDATRALMTEFYRLWTPKDGKPGLSAADALRQAQAFVRSQEKWKHPYFWGAWVLWGLPS